MADDCHLSNDSYESGQLIKHGRCIDMIYRTKDSLYTSMQMITTFEWFVGFLLLRKKN